jgi:hypothetical protein
LNAGAVLMLSEVIMPVLRLQQLTVSLQQPWPLMTSRSSPRDSCHAGIVCSAF